MTADRRRPRRRGGTPITSRRRGGSYETNKVIYVVCEGEVTEYQYLTMLDNEFGHRGFRLRFPRASERRKGLDPRRVVDRALEAADVVDADEVWALFDRDRHERIPEVFHDVKGHDKVRIGFSNPSFDLWLLLHLKLYVPQGRGSSEAIHAKLREHRHFDTFGSRDKRITEQRAELLAINIHTAVRNARTLVDRCPSGKCSARTGHAASCPPLARDPSSDVYLLIESLGIVSQR